MILLRFTSPRCRNAPGQHTRLPESPVCVDSMTTYILQPESHQWPPLYPCYSRHEKHYWLNNEDGRAKRSSPKGRKKGIRNCLDVFYPQNLDGLLGSFKAACHVQQQYIVWSYHERGN